MPSSQRDSPRIRLAGAIGPWSHDLTALLARPAFRHLWLSTCASSFTLWTEVIVTGWVALQLTGSPWLVAMTGVGRAVAMPLIGPLSGALADRLDRVLLVRIAEGGNLAALVSAGRDAARRPRVLLASAARHALVRCEHRVGLALAPRPADGPRRLRVPTLRGRIGARDAIGGAGDRPAARRRTAGAVGGRRLCRAGAVPGPSAARVGAVGCGAKRTSEVTHRPGLAPATRGGGPTSAANRSSGPCC